MHVTRLILMSASLLVAGCAGSPDVESATPPPAPALESYTESVDGSTITFDMVAVPGGTVTMDDGTTVEVEPFWMARTETTWDLFDVFVFETDKTDGSSGNDAADAVTRPSRPYVAPDRGYGHRGYAAISLAFKGADNCAEWLSHKTGRHYAIPTEAEWRHVCALGGIDATSVDAHGWHDGNSGDTPHPVGSLAPDALGIHDLYGNVREWAVAADESPIALGGSFLDAPDAVGPAGREAPTRAWQATDPQFPKSPWWLSDAPFMGMRVVCRPGPNPHTGDAE